MKQLLIYGANGYTGKMIVAEALRRGLRPILGGRNNHAITDLANHTNLSFRVFSLDDSEKLHRALQGIDTVLHRAGPFIDTARPLLNACLASRVHYLDINGEIPVFEDIFRRESEIKQAGIVVLPGVGFDVVPTDCLALNLARAAERPAKLVLAVMGDFRSISPGTMRSALRVAQSGIVGRRHGRLEHLPPEELIREIPFSPEGMQMTALAAPLAELVASYRSTGIAHITTYLAMPPIPWRPLNRLLAIEPLVLRTPGLWRLAGVLWACARKSFPPASPAVTRVAGEVTCENGARVRGWLSTGDGYRLTAVAAIEAAATILDGHIKAGLYSPAEAFGPEFVQRIDGVGLQIEATINQRSRKTA